VETNRAYGLCFRVWQENDDLEQVTHQVYFDIEIEGKPIGMNSMADESTAHKILWVVANFFR
jgi:hypothetical protein